MGKTAPTGLSGVMRLYTVRRKSTENTAVFVSSPLTEEISPRRIRRSTTNIMVIMGGWKDETGDSTHAVLFYIVWSLAHAWKSAILPINAHLACRRTLLALGRT